MPGYDPEKDQKIKEWKNEETGLLISIQQYGDGEPKLQIGPRILKKKAGRLSVEDVMWLYDIIDEVKDELSGLVGPE
jgi:hypothetical protein